ncbi:hypothetical protein [Shewanella psychrotolerans]|uniref:hypothetical protein n=1 Tax=Shewanella psychrotolerans TaxID=2864206 RepID=UPI001C660906|nr:hypothetical protein [Shewanella psychrotolerans]QYK00347.1 hypothetical protein K0I62_13150 [Shewanella psychrotolerans]
MTHETSLIIAKKASQAQLLFPKSQYPTHRAYIELFTMMLSKQDICVIESDIEILSIALGNSSHQLFKTVSSKASLTEKLDSLIFDGLKLKIDARKRLAADQSELSKDSNSAVIDLIFEKYKVERAFIEAFNQQTINEQKIERIEEEKAKTKASPKRLLEKITNKNSYDNCLDATALIKKQTIKAKSLFPENLYPHYRRFIDFLIQQATNDSLRLSGAEMERLSSAFGSEELAAFVNLRSHNTIEDKLKHITFSGLQLKISAKKRLKDTGSELSTIANISVIREITKQYQGKLNAIEAKKNQEREAQRQAAQAKRLRDIKDAEIERLKKFSDFPQFDIKNIPKGSRGETILKKLLTKPISQDEKNWLDNEGISSERLESKYYLQLAHQHYQNWKQKKLPWELVNASAAYRKARELKKIKKALDETYPFKDAKKDKKLRSALLTTYGGVCRDLQEYGQGIKFGSEAHNVTPLNFRPCTLLGAIYLSTGEFTLGHEWYDKAKERGFSQAAYDNDIKSVYFRASDNIKSRLKQNLIATGHKYDWLSKP